MGFWSPRKKAGGLVNCGGSPFLYLPAFENVINLDTVRRVKFNRNPAAVDVYYFDGRVEVYRDPPDVAALTEAFFGAS